MHWAHLPKTQKNASTFVPNLKDPGDSVGHTAFQKNLAARYFEEGLCLIPSLHTTVYWQLRRVDAHCGKTVQSGCPFRAVDSFEPHGPHKPSTAYPMMHQCSTYNIKYL